MSEAQVRNCLAKAEQYLDAANSEIEQHRPIAATSLAVHAAINAADSVTGHRIGRRAAGQDHDQVCPLLRQAGKDGEELDTQLARLLPLKTRAEYEPNDVPMADAKRAVERARRCVAIARRVVLPP